MGSIMGHDGGWRRRSWRYLFESRWMKLRQDEITLPSGAEITYTVIEHPGFVVIVPVLATAMLYLWPRTRVGKRFILPDQDATLAQMPVNLELEQLRGRYGQALSDLRPAGVAAFDGKRIDVITEGMMVTAGGWVRCVDVKAGKVVVRQVDKPRLQDLESADFS